MESHLQELKTYVTIVMTVLSILTVIGSGIVQWALVKYRIQRLERVIFGNGTPGIQQVVESLNVRQSTIEAICREHHRMGNNL